MNSRAWLSAVFVAVATVLLTGCDLVPLHMRDQPRVDPLEESQFFADGLSARPVPANTIPRGEWGELMLDEHLYTGQIDGQPAETFPMPVTRELLDRGQERYDIFCSPCHGRVGDGQGMIVQRGFQQPSSFHTDRLRQEPVGYYYDVISNGFGVMYSYGSRIHPEDRWAIIAYIRALQLSQNVPLEVVPEEQRLELESLAED